MVVLEEHTLAYGLAKKLFYLAAGPADGTLMIFAHGWPGIGKTWKPQLEAFSLLGFRVIAPDMPGYGQSTADKRAEDYSMENVNAGMLALLQHLGRDKAIWIGHDWGCPAVWSFAAHYPEHTIAVGGIAVPYGVIELGLEEEVKTVNRDIYPEDQYPYGQWDYQRFYETDFDKATAFFDADIPAVLRLMFRRAEPQPLDKPGMTATVSKDGGWFGGLPKPDPLWRHIPTEQMSMDEEMFQEMSDAMEKTGFWCGNAWYLNHALNRAYFFEKAKNGGNLEMPVLFIEAAFDTVCATANSGFAEPQRKYCKNLTETSVQAGHWAGLEQPALVNAAIARWLAESVKDYWPIGWTRGGR